MFVRKIIAKLSPYVQRFAGNGANSTDKLGTVIAEHLNNCPKIKCGIFDGAQKLSIKAEQLPAGGKKSIDPIAILRTLRSRFASAIEFLSHGHNPESMVARSELKQLIAEAPRYNIGLSAGRQSEYATIAADPQNVERAKQMLTVMN